MSEADRELVDLRREIVEARNQAIKTDNQVKNLSLDIKAFERRFDVLERRTRISGLGTHLLVALTVIVASYFVQAVRVRSAEQSSASELAEAQAAQKAAEQGADTLRARVAALEQERSRHDRAAAVVAKLVEHLDNDRTKEAADLLEGLDVSALTALESRVVDRRISDLRRTSADAAFRAGRAAQMVNRADAAVAEFKRCIAFEPDGRLAPLARYQLATQLWTMKRYDEAEPLLRDIVKHEPDKAIVEETRYLLATALASQGKRDEAKVLFLDISQKPGRYTTSAREQLAALEASGQLVGAGQAKPASPTAPAAATLAATPAPAPAPTPGLAPAPAAAPASVTAPAATSTTPSASAPARAP